MIVGMNSILFITVFLWIYLLFFLLFGKKEKIRKRLQKHVSGKNVEKSYYDMEEEKTSIKEKLLAILGIFTKTVYKKSYLKRKKLKLAQAAVLMKAEEFVLLSIATGCMVGILMMSLVGSILLGLIGFFLGFKLPDIIIKILRDTRMKKMKAQLPDALAVLSNGLRAGFSFLQALGIASKEMNAPIGDEFERVLRENSMGKPLEEALRELVERTEDEDIDLFVTAITIQRQVGGNLSEILETISNTIKERIHLQGEIKTMTAEGKFTATVISILPIAMAIIFYFINPTYIAILYQTQMGLLLIGAAAALEIIGVYLITKIVTINI